MGQFYLFFSSDPPAVDAIRHDFIIFNNNVDEATHELVEGQDYNFKLLKCTIKKKPVYETVRGRLLRSGTKTYLESLQVNAEGEILGHGAGLKGRKKELAALKAKQQQAQATELQDVAEDLLQNGPKVSRLPKERSEALKDEIKDKISSLPCFQNDGTKIEILRGKGIFLDAGKLGVLRQELGNEPDKHYQALLTLTLQPILGTDGVSAKGKRNCVQVPDKLTETLLLYTTQVFMGLGGDRNDIKFKPSTKLKNLLSNSKKKRKVVASGRSVPNLSVHFPDIGSSTPSQSTMGENSNLSPSSSESMNITPTPTRFTTLKPVTPDHHYFKVTRTLTLDEL